MSDPRPTYEETACPHHPDNVTIFNCKQHAEQDRKREEHWWSVITGIQLSAFAPDKEGRLFGARSKQHPV